MRSNKLVNRLGKNLREKLLKSEINIIEELQEFRKSFRGEISKIFEILVEKNQNINSNPIVTYRIKRIESIIKKLERHSSMKLSRMWDIGGCRCILESDEEVYKLRELIKKSERIIIHKENDYIKVDGKEKTGYKAIHLYVSLKDSKKRVEVQLRTKEQHNWATLVEITDLLYDSNLKEYSEENLLLEFHKLLSKRNSLEPFEKEIILKTVKKYNFYNKLSSVFSRNYIDVRRQWHESIKTNDANKYYLIESEKENVPQINHYRKFSEAEEKYFEKFREKQSSNIVLVHLANPTYENISIAYSNYILTMHSFLNDFLDIMEESLIKCVSKFKCFNLYKNYKLYNETISIHINNLSEEIITLLDEEIKKKENRNRREEKKWLKDIEKKVNMLRQRRMKLSEDIEKSLKNEFLKKFMIYLILKAGEIKVHNFK